MKRILWYVASSVSTFETSRYGKMQKLIEKAVKKIQPESEFIYAKGLYPTSQAWLVKWPLICKDITGGLIFFLDGTSWIGRGVYTEMRAIWQKHLPVYLCTDQGELIEVPANLESPRFTSLFDTDDWKRYLQFSIIPQEKPEAKTTKKARA